MLRVWSCILGCLGFLLDGWPILPMFFCLLCVVSSYLTMKNSNMEAEAMKIRISTGRGAAAMHALLSATKKRQRCPTHFAVDEQTQIAEFFQFLLTEACGKMGGTTVQRYWLVRQTGCRNAQISLCHTQPGPGKRSHVLKIRVFDQQNFDLFTGKDVFLLANTVIYPAKIAGFDDKHGRIFFVCQQLLGCYIATLFLQPKFWDVISKKTLAFTFWFCIIPLAQKWILPAKIEFQPAEAETSHARVVNGDVFFCLPFCSESWLLQLAAKT